MKAEEIQAGEWYLARPWQTLDSVHRVICKQRLEGEEFAFQFRSTDTGEYTSIPASRILSKTESPDANNAIPTNETAKSDESWVWRFGWAFGFASGALFVIFAAICTALIKKHLGY